MRSIARMRHVSDGVPARGQSVGNSAEERLARTRRRIEAEQAEAIAGPAITDQTPAAPARPVRTAVIVLTLCLWEAFPFSILGTNPLLSYQLYAAIAFAGVGLFLATRLLFRSIGLWEILPFALFVWCCFVSFIYSVYRVPQPWIQWLPAVYTVAPLLMIFFLKSIRASISDAIAAFYWLGALASALIVLESFLHTGLLDYYSRGSAFSEGRIVFFKLPSAFCLMIAIIFLLREKRVWKLLQHTLVICLTGYNLFVLTESRLLILGFFIAAGLTWMFVIRGLSKLITGILAPLVLIPLAAFVVSRYLYNVSSLEQYLSQDTSANWRRLTDTHFASYFYRETQGLGFGFMSANENYNNLLAFSSNRASKLYGVYNYSVGLDDIGLMASLYQYGYVGFAFTLGMSLVCIFTLVRSIRYGSEYAPVAAIGMLMGSLMLNPVPLNYFTIFYGSHVGALLWFIASETRYGSPGFGRGTALPR